MNGSKRNVVSIVHIVGVGRQGHLVKIISERCVFVEPTIFVNGIDKFFNVCTLVDALIRIIGVSFTHLRFHHNLFHELIDRHALAFHNPTFHKLAEIFQLLLGCARKAEHVQIKQRIINGELVFKGIILQHFHRFRANAALGEIDNSRQCFAIKRVVDKPQISKHVLDFFSFKELETTEHLKGYAVS